ncbi:MAG: zinc ABC transporter substrate-binding protein [Spirochaetes bacterium]|nr:zinc ABC transporter substrate-binding protein [Spirochaetota bacterium]
MVRKSPALLACLLALAAFPLAPVLTAASAATSAAADVPVVAVSILPQAEFVQAIAGDRVKVLVLVGPGSSPHSYEPTPRQMVQLSSAKIWFALGVDFEKGLRPKIAKLYPFLSIVDTSQGVVMRSLEADADELAGGRDQHIWLGREAVKVQLRAVAKALSALLPAESATFASNLSAYEAKIDAVFSGLKRELAPFVGTKVLVFHPSFGYFFDDFGLVQEAVEAGGKEPTQRVLSDLVKRAKAAGARTIFVQKQFPVEAAKTVASAIGGSVVEIDPLSPAWLENIGVMGAALKKSLTR